MLKIESLRFERGERVLFDNVDLELHAGQRVAITGRNGVGKSTLLDLIVGDLSTSKGSIDMPRSWRVGYMPQEVDASPQTAINYVIDGHFELREVERKISGLSDDKELANLYLLYEDLGGYEAESRAGRILNGLGFHAEEFEKPFEQFSGGWRIRLNLAKALMLPSQLLILDEPTNHLDVEAILWLEKWLLDFDGLLVMVAHDRLFLDSVATDILHISDSMLRHYSGNYSSFERARTEQILQQRAAVAKQDQERKRIKQFVDRFRAKASKAKQVQSRIKALERLTEQSLMAVDSDYRVSFEEPEKISNPLLSFRKLSVGYNSDLVLQEISQSILPGARIGLLGANGAGKSTLLKCLVGELEARAGQLETGKHCKIGYFAQQQLEVLNKEMTALELFNELNPELQIQSQRDYLGLWGFDKDKIERRIASLSGGEKARLVLAIISAQKPALLILDEPTNHLDVDMRDALALALQTYGGAIVLVAHDRDLMDKLVDEFWLLDGGRLSSFSGDMGEYVALKKESVIEAKSSQTPENESKRELRQSRAKERQRLSELSDQVKSIESDIEKQQAELARVEGLLADKETYNRLPAQELSSLLESSGRLRQELAQLEDIWLNVSRLLEKEEEGV